MSPMGNDFGMFSPPTHGISIYNQSSEVPRRHANIMSSVQNGQLEECADPDRHFNQIKRPGPLDALPQQLKISLSSSSSGGDEDLMNSKRLRKLHLHDAKLGQKRLPEENADGDRRFKQSKSPCTLKDLPQELKKSISSGSCGGDEDSMHLRRLQKLLLHHATPGQKRLSEKSADGDRCLKLSKSPVGLDAHQEAFVFQQELAKDEVQQHHMTSGSEAKSPSQMGRTSSGLLFPTNARGRSVPRRNHRRTNRQDRSTYDRASEADEHTPQGDTSMLLQPGTQPITAEHLVNKVKGIYTGLVMVEKKCVTIIAQRVSTRNKLNDDQSQALIALPRTLLHEHHDFFLASQHPTASPALRRLAQKYAMPARMWRNGIHAFVELLRQQLPASYDHMLAFVYVAYSMMALLKESIPSFLETWIECLGDLARYRMAMEEVDMCDREIWSNVARMWYSKAADRSPNVGRIQHHSAALARPRIAQHIFYYSKAPVNTTILTEVQFPKRLTYSSFGAERQPVQTEPALRSINPRRQQPSPQVSPSFRTPSPAQAWKFPNIVGILSVLETKHVAASAIYRFVSLALAFLLHVCGGGKSHCRPIRRQHINFIPFCILLLTGVDAQPDDVSRGHDMATTNDRPSTLLSQLLNLLLTWTPLLFIAVLVVFWTIQKASTNPVSVYRWTTLTSAFASVVFGDARTAAQVRYPTTGAGLILHLLYTQALFPDISSGLGRPAFLVASTFGLDASICQLAASSEGTSPRLFVSFLLPSVWLVVTATHGLPRMSPQIRRYIIRALDDGGGQPDVEALADTDELALVVNTGSDAS